MSLAVITANAARIAETPAAGASGRFGHIGPGALGVVRFELAKIGATKSSVDPADVRAALTGVPLSSDPFTALALQGLMDSPRGKTGQEGALLAEALRRDPRSRPARILLLRQLAASGDLPGAFNQLAVLQRLNPGLVQRLIAAVTAKIETPKQMDDALNAIEGHDELYEPFVTQLTGKPKPRDVVRRLAERLPASVIADRNIRNHVVRQLVDAGEYSAARVLWQKGNSSGASGLVYAPDFSDRKAPPPFNWDLNVSSTGAAERAKNGGLSVVYYDREPGILASQLLTLPIGAFQAQVEFDALGGTAGNVHLRLVCEGVGTILGEAPLVATRPGRNRQSLTVKVPAAACAAQRLAIVGVAAEERGETQLMIHTINVLPVRAAQ